MVDLKIKKTIYYILIAFCMFLTSSCNGNKDMTELSGNVNQVTYASENDNINLTASNTHNALYRSNSQVKQFQKKQLSSFSTKFNPGSIGRKNNITLAAKSIDGKTVQPGEVFSFNDTVGPTNKRKGFSLAKIFVNGKEAEGYGGGVCQVSSTLYNAADQAGMEIVERHPHTKRVHYVEKNRDAATSYGVIDFKFKNTLNNPVKISTSVKGDRLTVNLTAV